MATLDIDRLLLLDGSNEDIILAIMADVLTLKIPSEAMDGLESAEGSVSRHRLGLEAVRPFPLSHGASLFPSPSNRGPSLSMGHAMGATQRTAWMPAEFHHDGGSECHPPALGNGLKQSWPMASPPVTTASRSPLPWRWSFPSPAEATVCSGPWRPSLNRPGRNPWRLPLQGKRQEQNGATSPVEHSLKLLFSSYL